MQNTTTTIGLTRIKQQLPFQQIFHLKLEEHQQGSFKIQVIQNNRYITSPQSFAEKLFYKHEPSFYGLKKNVSDLYLFVEVAQMIELLTPTYRHPFIQLVGVDEFSQNTLAELEACAEVWESGEFWKDAKLQNQTFVFNEKYGSILTTAVHQKLANFSLNSEQLESLAYYFKEGGWPITSEHSAGQIHLALRLSEPDVTDDYWLLETIVQNKKTGSIWTPSKRTKQLPISIAIPEKWKQHTANIEDYQNKVFSLLSLDQVNSYQTVSCSNFFSISMSDAEVKQFLQYTLPLLQMLGYDVMLPAWLKELNQTRFKVRVTASSSNSKSVAGLDDILSFKWQFSMNNEEISEEQFQKLVEEKREFIRVGNEWFRIDADWLEQMKQIMQQADAENWTVRELLFKELPESLTESLEEDEAEVDPLFAFNLQHSLKQFVEQLANKKGLPPVAKPKMLQAELRPYQQEGFEWLAFMRKQGFGACLADDMGLGKTVQLIAYISYSIEQLQVTKPSLIICPTSVLGNWQKELERFAPTLNVYTHYSSSRLKGEDLLKKLTNDVRPQLVLTTFGTVTQDIELLQAVEWNIIGLDEAQNIKNMQTQQSRSIRKLRGEHHVALTGTPIENRLSELWAIFDFIHKGYLGSFKKFQEKYIVPIERDESEKHKHQLRMKIKPFLLRRTKRDPELKLNLPDKLEMEEYCPLTAEQAALYEGYIQDTMAKIEQMSAFEKRGHILKMLNKLKQLCNHPALFLKEPLLDADSLMKRSLKLNRIVSMAAEIVDNGEQCLIFTQYIGMGNMLQYVFNDLYQLDVPFLTGSMSKSQRDRLVEAFQQGDFPIFILSLKAGGTGLNLTKANHVLHADRWWNPAVENQATDRAYRIGQKQFVQVHKFVTLGTIEEKIDKMLRMKSALSEELIQSSNWITELNDEELKQLLTLD